MKLSGNLDIVCSRKKILVSMLLGYSLSKDLSHVCVLVNEQWKEDILTLLVIGIK